MKKILDMCCGSKMFWFEKNREDVIFTDIREFEDILSDGRIIRVNPDIVADFRKLPFEDEKFCEIYNNKLV